MAWLPAGRGVLVGVGVAMAAPELHDAITRHKTSTMPINSQGQTVCE